MATNDNKYATVTVYGRLSFPTLTAEAAHQLAQKGEYPTASAAEATPSAMLMLEKPQADKFKNFCLDSFLPELVKREGLGEKRNALSAADVKVLTEATEAEGSDVYNTPFKSMTDKDEESFPEAVMKIGLRGQKGQDLKQMAIVNDESELTVPDPDILEFPIIRNIGQTVHELYPGAIVAVTINLYSYKNGKLPGYSAGCSTLVFKADADRIGGGSDFDEDEIFMD